MANHPNRRRTRVVEMTLSPTDVRALEYVLSHLQSIRADFPESGAGNGYDATTVRDMHNGTRLVRYLAYCGRHGQTNVHGEEDRKLTAAERDACREALAFVLAGDTDWCSNRAVDAMRRAQAKLS